MQFPLTLYKLQHLLSGQPTVGSLIDLCEENYHLLLSVAPELASMTGSHSSRLDDSVDLHLEVLAQSRYTSIVRLTYYFDGPAGVVRDPDVTLRVYHDAQQVELFDLRQSALPVGRLFEAPGLRQKWKVNLFLSKWLAFCARQGHRFPTPRRPASCEPRACPVGAV